MPAALFVDAGYINKLWMALNRTDYLDYLKLREHLEATYCNPAAGDRILEAYYFTAKLDPGNDRMDAYLNALSYPPPVGPGFRVKVEWCVKEPLFWPKSLGGAPVLHPSTGEQYELIRQKAVDVSLAFHLILSHTTRQWTKLFLATGDGDFKTPIQYLVEYKGVELVLIGNLQTISEQIRPYACEIIRLDEVAEQFARPRPQSGKG